LGEGGVDGGEAISDDWDGVDALQRALGVGGGGGGRGGSGGSSHCCDCGGRW
jgi:hypothetical protein